MDTLAIIGTQLVTFVGILYYLGQRIDAQGRDLREEMRQLRTEVRADIDRLREELRTDIGRVGEELRAARAEVSGRLDAHIERHAT